MALTLAAMYTDATNVGAYANTVAAAAAVAAVAVLNEDPATANHALRLAWAQKTLDDPVAMGKKMLWGVLGDQTVVAALPNVSDAIVQASVNALVNGFVNA